MTITEGSLVSICYDFWPEDGAELVMALVKEIHDDMYVLCPVHNEMSEAGFYDLIVPPDENSLNCTLVINSKLSLKFWKNAIIAGKDAVKSSRTREKPARRLNRVRAGSNPTLHCYLAETPVSEAAYQVPVKNVPYNRVMKSDLFPGMNMIAPENARILKNLAYILENDEPDTAYSGPLRGKVAGAQTRIGKALKKLETHWQMFHLKSLCNAVEANIENFPEDLQMDFVIAEIRQSASNRKSGSGENKIIAGIRRKLKKLLGEKYCDTPENREKLKTTNGILELAMTFARQV